MRKLLFFLALGLLIAAAAWFYRHTERGSKPPSFSFAKVERGSIASTVSSTGTLNAVVTVKVGSQVSGQIKELLADFNSEVRQGEVIARIAPEDFEARVRQAEADLAVARANVVIQRAAVERSRAELQNARAALVAARAQVEKTRVIAADAKRELDRKQSLYRRAVISQREIDQTRAAHEQSLAQLSTAEAEQEAQASLVRSREAQLKMAEAQVAHAQAQVMHRDAALYQSRIDLEHTVIRSPVNGVVIERSVDIGQTVAASLQAPTLFTIAQDLRKMQVDTSLDEADIGRIQVSQRATFTVDAFPGHEFTGQIQQIRKAPQTVQNVVTYTVVVSAENPDLRLLPGMTANVKILVKERQEVLKVPNAALRFKPTATETGGGSPLMVRQPGQGVDGGSEAAQERFRRLTETLGLDQEQQVQLRGIFAEGRKRIISMRRQGATPEDIRIEIQRMREKNRGVILGILTPEQREKFRQIASAREANPVTRGQIWILGDDGKPVPLEVFVGISDGSFTEIVRGQIEAGQRVIIGTAQTPRRPSNKRPPRFGF